jgi:hypothetical protein
MVVKNGGKLWWLKMVVKSGGKLWGDFYFLFTKTT